LRTGPDALWNKGKLLEAKKKLRAFVHQRFEEVNLKRRGKKQTRQSRVSNDSDCRRERKKKPSAIKQKRSRRIVEIQKPSLKVR